MLGRTGGIDVLWEILLYHFVKLFWSFDFSNMSSEVPGSMFVLRVAARKLSHQHHNVEACRLSVLRASGLAGSVCLQVPLPLEQTTMGVPVQRGRS
jgi:hypothetical protein